MLLFDKNPNQLYTLGDIKKKFIGKMNQATICTALKSIIKRDEYYGMVIQKNILANKQYQSTRKVFVMAYGLKRQIGV